VEFLLQCKDSSPIRVEFRRHPLRSDDGWTIFGQMLDITTPKKAEAILLASETRFRNNRPLVYDNLQPARH
jgi:hypothetical protein